ncbi:hypothetical protein CEXT_70501 [Caerostris extrusa]|uniref:Uncharacterized protein n=1 Tax=Caerostris extrusa TaxID=172846 RepID=A0AAV4R5D9_CAEEX|nr:hypothetical protein CEXT_70501 [Caerostris extrusa]
MLSTYKLVPNKEDLDNIENLRYLWEQTQKQSTETQNSLLDMKTQFQAQLTDNISSFTNEFEKFQRDYQEKGPLVVGLSAMEASIDLPNIKTDSTAYGKKIYDKYTDGAILFGYKCKRVPSLALHTEGARDDAKAIQALQRRLGQSEWLSRHSME